MTLLNWIKSRSKTSPLIQSQTDGLTVLALIGLVIIFIASAFFWNPPRTAMAPFLDRKEGTVAVELAGDVAQRGIYYLPDGETLESFLKARDVPLPADSAFAVRERLSAGTTVTVGANGLVRVGPMAAAKRLALDLPIDVNTATGEDLVLIPGLKEATARRILAFREASGGRIGRLEDLLQVDGIKEKRLQQLRPYLYVTDRTLRNR